MSDPLDDSRDHEMADAIRAFYDRTPEFNTAARARLHARLRNSRVSRSSQWRWPALAAAIALIAFGVGFGTGRVSHHEPRSSDANALEPVRFVLHAPRAAGVSVVGDFNRWNPNSTRLAHDPRTGTWEVTVRIAPGRHVYAFVIDDSTWTVDPLAPRGDDDFGVPNAVLLVKRRT